MEQRERSIFKVFIGSPGDVQQLRETAFNTIQQLNRDPLRPDDVEVQGFGWDVTDYPKLINQPPQANIEGGLPDMASYDLCLFIIGSRLGTELDDTFEALADGRRPTGTEYEFHSALQAQPQPDIQLYHLDQALQIEKDATPGQQRDAFQQFQAAQAFVAGVEKDERNHYRGEVVRIDNREAFGDQLNTQLRLLLKRKWRPGEHTRRDEPTDTVPRDYLEWLKEQLPAPSLKGMGGKAGYAVTLPAIYVPALVPARADQKEDRQAPRERESHALLIDRLSGESLYLSGMAGSGKSTFCHWLCWQLIEGGQLAHPLPAPEAFAESPSADLLGRLPLLCRLRGFWGHMHCQADNGEWSRVQLEKALSAWVDLKAPTGLDGATLLRWIAAGRCLLIFDGVDEVPERSEQGGLSYPRRCLLSGLARAIPHWQQSGNRILLTSRPYGLGEAERRAIGLDESPLQALPGELQQLFMQRWFAATRAGDEGQYYAEDLWRHLRERDEAWLGELVRNPLLLTALCVKFGEDKVLPTDQHELFDAVVESTLYSRFTTRATEVEPVRRRLDVVAWAMQSGEVVDLGSEDFVAQIGLEQLDAVLVQFAQANPLSEGSIASAGAKRDELLNRTGLLTSVGDNAAGFYHRTFQDFFAAEYIRRNTLDVADLLARHAGNEDWHEVFVFLLSGLIRQGAGVDRPLALFKQVLTPALDADALATNPQPAVLWGRCLELLSHRIEALGDLGTAYARACETALEVVANPLPRARLFTSLARIGGDRRPGVGLDANGLPDIDWVRIEGGAFVYGENKQTAHVEPFEISRYPVTNAQFQAFVDAGDYTEPRWWQGLETMQPATPAWSEANRPRETVSWYEALAFCRWLSHHSGRKITLPNERQWERAVRGTEGREYPWGDGDVSGRANIDETWGDSGPYKLGMTSAVGIYPRGASQEGAADLAGNVWEWCLNKYDDPSASAADTSGDARVLRGGSWLGDPGLARAANRSGYGPGSRDDDVGFRVLCSGPFRDH